MALTLNLKGLFPSEEAVKQMILRRKVCFDHEPFQIRVEAGRYVSIGFQMNWYAAFKNPHHSYVGDKEYKEMVGELLTLCKVLSHSAEIFEPFNYPEPSSNQILHSPQRRYRAEIRVQTPIINRSPFGTHHGEHLTKILSTTEEVLKDLGARQGRWD